MPAARGRAAQSGPHRWAPAGSRRGNRGSRAFFRAGAGRRRDRAGARHAGCGVVPFASAAPPGPGPDAGRFRSQRAVRGGHQDAAPVPAVDDARPRRMAGAAWRGITGNHDRRVDPAGEGAGPDRSGGRLLAAAAAGGGWLARAGAASERDAAGGGADGAAGTAGAPGGAQPHGGAAGLALRGGAAGVAAPGSRPGGGNRRRLRRRQVDAGACARRSVAAAGRLGASGRRRTGPLRQRRARAPHRLSAAGSGTVRGHRGGEHRAHGADAGRCGGGGRGETDRSARDDSQAGRRVRLSGCGRRRGAVRRAAPTHRAGTRVLRIAGSGDHG